MLEKVAKTLKSKSSKRDTRVYRGAAKGHFQYMAPARRYHDISSMINDFSRTHHRFFSLDKYERATQLGFEDSFYNFTWPDFEKVFAETGAIRATGYGLLPLEFWFDHVPENNLYTVNRSGGRTYIQFKGYTNGYNHPTEAWEKTLSTLGYHCPRFNLSVEIVSRVGPFAIFCINRSNGAEIINRTIAMPENYQYVRIMDVIGSFDRHRGRFGEPRYISINLNEFFEALNYTLSLAEKSLVLQNVCVFIRRRMGGASLITQELLAPWHLPKRHLYKMAVVVFLQAKLIMETEEKAVAALDTSDFLNKVSRFMGHVCDAMLFPILLVNDLFLYIKQTGLMQNLVHYPDQEIFQKKVLQRAKRGKMVFDLDMDYDDEEEMPDCPICADLHGRLGEQLMTCEGEPYEHTFTLTDSQVKEVISDLEDCDKDTEQLATLKTRVKPNVPATGFSHKCRVEYIEGGPGAGKSFLLRQLLDQGDLVFAPFKKLHPDYRGLTINDPSGKEIGKYDLAFATNHRLLEKRGFAVMGGDEFTSFPYQYLAIAAFLNQAEVIYLVGDVKQTRIREGEGEGMYIGNYIPLDKLRKHTLFKNFRNPQDAVAVLNRTFGYNSYAVSDIVHSFYFCDIPSSNDLDPDLSMNFKGISAEVLEMTNNTVRSNQGATKNKVMLTILEEDLELVDKDSLFIVAISRHKETLHFACQNKTVESHIKTRLYGKAGPFSSDAEITSISRPNFTKPKYVSVSGPELDGVLGPKSKIGAMIPDRDTVLDDDEEGSPRSTSDTRVSSEHWRAPSVQPRRFSKISREIPRVQPRRWTHGKNSRECSSNSDELFSFPSSASTMSARDEDKYEALFLCADAKQGFQIGKTLVRPKISDWLIEVDRQTTMEGLEPLFDGSIPGDRVSMPFCIDIPEEVDMGLGEAEEELDASSDSSEEFPMRWDGHDDDDDQPDAGSQGLSLVPQTTDEVLEICGAVDRSKNTQEFEDYVTNFMLHPRFDFLISKPLDLVLPEENCREHPVHDAYLGAVEEMPNLALAAELSRYNERTSNLIKPDFSTGVIDVDIVCPLNQRRNLVKHEVTKLTASHGHGLVYMKDDKWQELQCLQSRYFGSFKRLQFSLKGKMVAEEMVDLFHRECISLHNQELRELEIFEIIEGFFRSCNEKHYQAQFTGQSNFDGRVIRFSMKDIFKPCKRTVSIMKSGQGISAWSKDANAMFGACIRLLSRHFRSVLKPGVVFNNGLSELELAQRVNSALSKIPKCRRVGITDGVQSDSEQNEFTQYKEKYHRRKLGYSHSFIELFYSLRHDYILQSSCARGNGGWKKTSGAPDTLLGNSELAMIDNNYLYRGDGPFCLLGQGDDGAKIQCNLRMNTKP